MDPHMESLWETHEQACWITYLRQTRLWIAAAQLPEHSSGLLTTLLNCQRHSMHNGTAHRADRAAGRRDEDTGRDVIRLFREKGLAVLAQAHPPRALLSRTRRAGA